MVRSAGRHPAAPARTALRDPIEALRRTLSVAVVGMVLATALGLLLAVGRLSDRVWVRGVVGTLIEFFRAIRPWRRPSSWAAEAAPCDDGASSGAPSSARAVTAATLSATMETTYAPPRRSLPPVPRAVDDPQSQQEAAQAFVTRLRAAAVDFAAAAGAPTAVVTEAVPPARHRRSRCRVVLRDAAGADSDLTFLGPAGSPGTVLRQAFDVPIQRWLAAGGPRDPRWLRPDTDSTDGVAIDLTAWLADA